ncbi:histidine utilization repressor [Ciceribacter ferrooxidans]|uniref:Histidine utilization repressor n=1 Tax=Ciceribacter ferrooxidans TaxID=2509717 RepID=A0A4Q2T5R3_9HYPH|nr:histidine utilization repressor [Ciceribacter ferrooxidans]RYC13992.1 histidine utilization repressor [Ciceribacter ferrooxidans]
MTTKTGSGKEATLHQRILRDIESRILSGEWPPGYRVPFEVDLATEYDCSRMTVNKVMTELAKAGLIERHRKAGSFVRQPQAQSAVLEIHDIEAEVKSLGLAYAFELVRKAERVASADDCRLLDIGEGAALAEALCIHFAGERPFCIEERLINLAVVPEATASDFAGMPPGRWLLRQVPWTTAEHKISAVSAEAETARMLRIAKGTACLVVERRTWSGQGPVTWVRFTYPGDSHTLVARFTPASNQPDRT